MASLLDWFQAAIDGRPRLVLCGGAPGIGKTRLAHELAAAAEARLVPVVWARAPEGVAPPPFLAVASVDADQPATGDHVVPRG